MTKTQEMPFNPYTTSFSKQYDTSSTIIPSAVQLPNYNYLEKTQSEINSIQSSEVSFPTSALQKPVNPAGGQGKTVSRYQPSII